MYKNKKIGVGIITYNRRNNFLQLYDSLKNIDYIDEIVIIKNKDIDYKYDFSSINDKTEYFNVLEDLGVGFCKNKALKYLIKKDCEHLFLIEDDTIIKKEDVFKYYIDTAENFNLEHLVFGYGSSGNKPNEFKEEIVTPHTIIKKGDFMIDFYHHLQGAFTYYTRNIIEKVGLFDDIHYINALEHVEHTYRICMNGAYSPFWAFGDAHESINYLGWLHEDEKYDTTIKQDNELYRQRLMNGFNHFRKVYNRNISEIPLPSKQEIQQYIIERTNYGK